MQTIQTVTVTMEVPKELKEIVDCVASLIKDIKAKKSLAEIGAGNLTKLIQAVEGHEHLDEEAKSAHKDEAAGYLVQQTMEALEV